jgi:hypothetical protein
MNTQLVPFGKYKGQPVEALAQDREYCEWLMGQDWFRTRFVGIHTLIVNHFGEPHETPEHNALQSRFLEDEWQRRFALAVGYASCVVWNAKRLLDDQREKREACGSRLAAAQRELDDPQKHASYRYYYEQEMARAIADIQAIDAQLNLRGEARWQSRSFVEFEVRGNDVVLDLQSTLVLDQKPLEWARGYQVKRQYVIECKPSLGDEYPAVLRQMKANDAEYLVVGEVRSQVVTADTVATIFGKSDIQLLTVAEIAAQPLEWPFGEERLLVSTDERETL